MAHDATLRREIKRTLDGVAGIGPTFDHYRHITKESGIQASLVKSGRLHFWCLCLVPSNAVMAERFPASCEHSMYTYDIHGFYAFSQADESEKVFAGLVEGVIDAFRNNSKLRDPAAPTVATCIDSGPLQWIEGGGPEAWRMMPAGEGGSLCHYARLRLPVKVHSQ